MQPCGITELYYICGSDEINASRCEVAVTMKSGYLSFSEYGEIRSVEKKGVEKREVLRKKRSVDKNESVKKMECGKMGV